MIKIRDLKVFGTSPEQIISAVAGQPLLEIPLNQIVLNMIGSVFVSENLAYLGQTCGELLRRLCGDTKMRHAILEKAREYAAHEDCAVCYAQLNVSLVILLHNSCVGLEADEASKILSTYFLQLEICSELLTEAN